MPSTNSLLIAISINHILNATFWIILATLIYLESKRNNGFTKALSALFAALALNVIWSIGVTIGALYSDYVRLFSRLFLVSILTAAQVGIIVAYIDEWRQGKR